MRSAGSEGRSDESNTGARGDEMVFVSEGAEVSCLVFLEALMSTE